MNRRDFLEAGIGGLALFGVLQQLGCNAQKLEHPWLFVTENDIAGLRTLESVRHQIPAGHSRTLWEALLSASRSDLTAPVLTPGSAVADRSAANIREYNADFVICNEAGQRILRHALVHLIIGEPGHRQAALAQMSSLFSTDQWPLWIDNAHVRFGHPAGLRTGMLARDVAIAYDWLYSSFSGDERRLVVNGLDARAIQPFLTSVRQDAWWLHDLNNWLTTIVGGVGIAGMALGPAHAESQTLIDLARTQFERYMTVYGSEGEFNESVAYANATERPVAFYSALQYATGGQENELRGKLFHDTARWMQYLTLPPGRIAALGDGHVDARPWVRHFAAIAAASRDGNIQSYYLDHASGSADPLELLWFDPTVSPVGTQGGLPLGRAFPAHGGCVSSRTSWDNASTPCVVYGKAGREQNHEHHDDGQVCIDGFGKRLIVDLGSPSAYPEDYFDEHRWDYYNASVIGHNILMVGGRELRALAHQRGDGPAPTGPRPSGRFINFGFDDQRGGFWQVDATPAYHEALLVLRTVVHALPGIAVVVDEAKLARPESVSLRWHTIDKADPDKDGSFVVRAPGVRCVSRIVEPGRGLALRRREHAYRAPFNRDRLGDLLEARNESYVEATATAGEVRFITLFAIEADETPQNEWLTVAPGRWVYDSSDGMAQVAVADDVLSVSFDDDEVFRLGLAAKLDLL